MKFLTPFAHLVLTSAVSVPYRAPDACPDIRLDAKTNIWRTYGLHPNIFWRKEVATAKQSASDVTIARLAETVGNQGTFLWMYSDIPKTVAILL